MTPIFSFDAHNFFFFLSWKADDDIKARKPIPYIHEKQTMVTKECSKVLKFRSQKYEISNSFTTKSPRDPFRCQKSIYIPIKRIYMGCLFLCFFLIIISTIFLRREIEEFIVIWLISNNETNKNKMMLVNQLFW